MFYKFHVRAPPPPTNESRCVARTAAETRKARLPERAFLFARAHTDYFCRVIKVLCPVFIPPTQTPLSRLLGLPRTGQRTNRDEKMDVKTETKESRVTTVFVREIIACSEKTV